jgi:SAM-dependent methyltransferase
MTAGAPPRDHARRAYEAMASVYDAFTAHHRYEEWTAMLERLAVGAGLRGTRLLDVACGTGKSYEPFLARGYSVTACDVSPRMLEHARVRRPGATLVEADMRALPDLGAFDLVCLLDDAVNYLDSPEELEATLAGVARNLAPDGVVVFDANTLAAYRSFFAAPSLVRDGDRLLVWDGRADPGFASGDACTAELHVFAPAGPPSRWSHALSVHRQRHHPRDAVERALRAAGFGWSRTWGIDLDGGCSDALDENAHTKAIHVARLTAPAPGERR